MSACKRFVIMMDHLFKLDQEGRKDIQGEREGEKMVDSMDWRSWGSQKIVGVGILEVGSWKGKGGGQRVFTWHSVPLYVCTELV